MDLPNIKEKVSEIVTSQGGVFEEKQVDEKRKLAYKVKHETHGIFVARRFELPESEKTKEITRKINLYPKVLRFLISLADELPELTSKEERTGKETPSQTKVTPKPETIVKKEEPKEEIKEEEKKEDKKAEETEEPKEKEPEIELPKEDDKKKADEDLDKKLEEILNI